MWEKTPLEGVWLHTPKVFPDDRGFFLERFRTEMHPSVPNFFPQINQSRSLPRVLRGLHIQMEPMQGKFISVVRGKIWDVAVDLRLNSNTFGKSYAVELDDQKNQMLWIPEGFAHGFCVLGEESADVVYLTSAIYTPSTDRGIHWQDPELNIAWPIKDPILSSKDQQLPGFSAFVKGNQAMLRK
jgi:dTDP-4-dehydrorhamnose 3,5-epimerase